MEAGFADDLFNGPGRQNLAAKLARAGTEVEQVVCRAQDVGIVLDDQDGVAQVAQLVEDADETGGVARMQADGGLVQHIERAHQPRAQRGRELDALRFPAGKSGGEAVEGEVIEADRVEESEALADLFQDAAGDLLLHGSELQVQEEAMRGGDGERGRLADVRCCRRRCLRRCARRGLRRAGAGLALGAERVAAVFGEHDADVELVLLALEQREEAVHAREGTSSVENKGLLLRGQIPPGNVERNAVRHAQLGAFRSDTSGIWAGSRDRSRLRRGFRLIGNDEVEVEVDGVAESLAAGAGAVGIVEGEEARLGLAVLAVAGGALKGSGKP